MNSVTITRFEPLDYATNEAINTLSANLSFAGPNIKTIMLTSCQPQEGKSFLTMNLMRTLADMGKRVVLVDADLRRSLLVSRYGIQASSQAMGLSHYLAGMCSLDDILCSTNLMDAYMILSGKDVANSLSLLSTPLLRQLMDVLARSFDYVLVDAPPVGVIIDAAEIAKSCDGVLFVVTDSGISRRELTDATRQIQKTGTPIVGAVLNKVSFDTRSAKRYYHRTYYTHYSDQYDKEQDRKRKKTTNTTAKERRG